MENSKIWMGMMEISDKMFLGKTNPNPVLVKEALSFDVSALDTIPMSKLRKYIVVLGQYLISIQFEENRTEAESSAWSKSLDMHVFKTMRGEVSDEYKTMKTVAERRAWILDKNEKALEFHSAYLVADAKKTIIKNMYRPIEQYINALKKEIDARTNERHKSYE